MYVVKAEELCESQSGRPRLPVSNTVIVLMVSVDVRQHLKKKKKTLKKMKKKQRGSCESVTITMV